MMQSGRKAEEEFRVYSEDQDSLVLKTYKAMHENQTAELVDSMRRLYASEEGYTDQQGNKITLPILEIYPELDKVVDESDPDNDKPQIFHAYQVGEELRSRYLQGETLKDISIKGLFPDAEWERLPEIYKQEFTNKTLQELYSHIKTWDWLPLIGFLHDLGKVLATPRWGSLEQWRVVGDTFPVGAPFSTSNVYHQQRFFKTNKDLNMQNISANKFGMYDRNCGFDKVKMSWGHDDYLFSVLKRTQNNFPVEALYIIHYHSFYPWHTPRNGERGYSELANQSDWMLLPLLKAFQQCDLYSKDAALPDVKAIEKYYNDLIQKYIPGKLEADNTYTPARIKM